MMNNIRSVTTVLRHRSPHGTFSIQRVTVGPVVYLSMMLTIRHKKSLLDPFSMRVVPLGPFSIQRVPVGPTVTHP